jgi:hypothetical protein
MKARLRMRLLRCVVLGCWVVLLASVHAAQAQETIEVTMATVDQDGGDVPGWVTGPGGYHGPAPYGFEMANGGSLSGYAIWGGLYGGTRQDLTIYRDHTYKIDVLTGAVPSPQPSETTRIEFVFERIPVTMATVDQDGGDVPGWLWGPGGYHGPAPYGFEMANGGSLSGHAIWGGLYGGTQQDLTIYKGTAYQVDALTGAVQSVQTSGTTRIEFAFERLEVTMATVDQDGGALGGWLWWPFVVGGSGPSPYSFWMAHGGSMSAQAVLDGQYGRVENLTLYRDTTYLIGAASGQVRSQPSPGQQAVLFVYPDLRPPDADPPEITATANPAVLWPVNGKLVPVTVTGTITDTGSGVDPASLTFAVADEYGRCVPRGSVTVGADGSFSFTTYLEASRKGQDLDGRRYAITLTGADMVGNLGQAAVEVIVPHDQRG